LVNYQDCTEMHGQQNIKICGTMILTPTTITIYW